MEDWENTSEINLPIRLIHHTYNTGHITPGAFRTLIYLHLARLDQQIITPEFYIDVAGSLKLNVKTVRNHLSILLNANYIGINRLTDRLYVRSFKKILPTEYEPNTWAVKITFEHLKSFPEFIIASVIAYQVYRCSVYFHKTKRPALECEGALQAFYLKRRCSLKGFAISLSLLSKFLNRSTSWVDKYKIKATKLKLISVKHDYQDTGVNYEDVTTYLKANPQHVGRVRKSSNGKIMLVATDILTSTVILKKEKKWKKGL